MSHVSSFQKPFLQTLLGFSGSVSVCHAHSPRCSRAKKSFWGRFPVGSAFERISSRPWSSQGSLVKTVTSCCNLFSLWPIQCPPQWLGVETRDHLKNSLLLDVESIESDKLNLGFSQDFYYMDLNIVWCWVLSETDSVKKFTWKVIIGFLDSQNWYWSGEVK